jgi:hypothetical protein
MAHILNMGFFIMSLPDDIIFKAYRAFCAGQRKNDRASLAAIGLFLERVEKGQISHTKARQMLSDDKKIEGIIEKVQAQFEQETRNAQKKVTPQKAMPF